MNPRVVMYYRIIMFSQKIKHYFRPSVEIVCYDLYMTKKKKICCLSNEVQNNPDLLR